jgi:hypothetical protein
LEEARFFFFFFVEAAEQGLNHESGAASTSQNVQSWRGNS